MEGLRVRLGLAYASCHHDPYSSVGHSNPMRIKRQPRGVLRRYHDSHWFSSLVMDTAQKDKSGFRADRVQPLGTAEGVPHSPSSTLGGLQGSLVGSQVEVSPHMQDIPPTITRSAEDSEVPLLGAQLAENSQYSHSLSGIPEATKVLKDVPIDDHPDNYVEPAERQRKNSLRSTSEASFQNPDLLPLQAEEYQPPQVMIGGNDCPHVQDVCDVGVGCNHLSDEPGMEECASGRSQGKTISHNADLFDTMAGVVDRLFEKFQAATVKVVALDDLQQQLREHCGVRGAPSNVLTSLLSTTSGSPLLHLQGAELTVVEKRELALQLYGLRDKVREMQEMLQRREAQLYRDRKKHSAKAGERTKVIRVEVQRQYESPPQEYRKPPFSTARKNSQVTQSSSTNNRSPQSPSTSSSGMSKSTSSTSSTNSSTDFSSSSRSLVRSVSSRSAALTSASSSIGDLFRKRRAEAAHQRQRQRSSDSGSERLSVSYESRSVSSSDYSRRSTPRKQDSTPSSLSSRRSNVTQSSTSESSFTADMSSESV